MGLDNIQLTPTAILDLYRDVLVENSTPKPRQSSVNDTKLLFLGQNNKKIAILVKKEEILYLPDDELQFLLGILSACKLNMADVAILNLEKNEHIDYLQLMSELMAEKILLFGVTPTEIGLPLQFPNYQVQKYNNQVYVSSPALNALVDNKEEKTKLWNALKQVFNI